MQEIRPGLFGLLRLANVGAGLLLLLGLRGPSSGAASTFFVYLIAFPFLLLPLVPGRWITVFFHSFLAGFGGVLAPALWAYTIFVLLFSFDRSLWPLYGTMAAAATGALTADIIVFTKLPSQDRGALPVGIALGLLYFPVAWQLASQQVATRTSPMKGAQDLYGPAACVFKYRLAHDKWPISLGQGADIPGCPRLPKDIQYQLGSSGFSMQTKGTVPLYYIDETGIVRADGPSGRIVDVCGHIVSNILFRLRQYMEGERQYPLSLDMLSYLNAYLQQQQTALRCSISYDRESGNAFHFTARPKQYGVTGLRSYYADQTGVVHATPFDRAATLNDPLAPEPELHGL